MDKKVYKAINAVQTALAKSGIAKDRINQQGASYKFRGIDDVYNAISPLLGEHGLCILPRMISRDLQERLTAQGKAIFYVTIEAEFDFVSAEDGSCHVVRTFGEAMDMSDKATNKAMSAAYKYACLQAFAIPTEGDNDSETETIQPAPINAKTAINALPDRVLADFIAAIHASADMQELQTNFQNAYRAAQGANDQPAVETFTKLKNKLKEKFEKKDDLK
jgi:ERF superfamily